MNMSKNSWKFHFPSVRPSVRAYLCRNPGLLRSNN